MTDPVLIDPTDLRARLVEHERRTRAGDPPPDSWELGFLAALECVGQDIDAAIAAASPPAPIPVSAATPNGREILHESGDRSLFIGHDVGDADGFWHAPVNVPGDARWHRYDAGWVEVAPPAADERRRFGGTLECGCWHHVMPGSYVGMAIECPRHGQQTITKCNVPESERTFGPNVRCSVPWCAARLDGQPIRHVEWSTDASSDYGPACERHANAPAAADEPGEDEPPCEGADADEPPYYDLCPTCHGRCVVNPLPTFEMSTAALEAGALIEGDRCPECDGTGGVPASSAHVLGTRIGDPVTAQSVKGAMVDAPGVGGARRLVRRASAYSGWVLDDGSVLPDEDRAMPWRVAALPEGADQ